MTESSKPWLCPSIAVGDDTLCSVNNICASDRDCSETAKCCVVVACGAPVCVERHSSQVETFNSSKSFAHEESNFVDIDDLKIDSAFEKGFLSNSQSDSHSTRVSFEAGQNYLDSSAYAFNDLSLDNSNDLTHEKKSNNSRISSSEYVPLSYVTNSSSDLDILNIIDSSEIEKRKYSDARDQNLSDTDNEKTSSTFNNKVEQTVAFDDDKKITVNSEKVEVTSDINGRLMESGDLYHDIKTNEVLVDYDQVQDEGRSIVSQRSLDGE